MNAPDQDRREEEAALWAARCADVELGPEDRAALDSWLGRDPAHRVLLEQYLSLSRHLDVQLPALAARGAVAAPWPLAPVRPSRRWLAPLLGAAAVAAAAAAFWLGRSARSVLALDTAAAQRRTVTLADGSQVELNARTRLIVDRDGAVRRVRLQGGEAYFIVAKEHGRPFIVDTPAGTVRVTGTRFDVCSETLSGFEVTVAEGTVQVRPAGAPAGTPFILGAGDRFADDAGRPRVTRLSAAALGDALAWRDGQVVCDGTPLQEALARFAWYHGCAISVAPDAAKLQVVGRFSLDDLDGFLATIEQGLPVRVQTGPSGILVTRAPNN